MKSYCMEIIYKDNGNCKQNYMYVDQSETKFGIEGVSTKDCVSVYKIVYLFFQGLINASLDWRSKYGKTFG